MLAGKARKNAKYQEGKFSPKRKFWAGHPCGRPAKNFGQALQILKKQAFWNGHPTRTSMKKLRSEKLRADFSFPKIGPTLLIYRGFVLSFDPFQGTAHFKIITYIFREGWAPEPVSQETTKTRKSRIQEVIRLSGASFRRGDFASREPEFGVKFWDANFWAPNFGVEFWGPMFSNKKSPLKNLTPKNSPPKIHIKKFTPESGLKNSHCTSAGPFCWQTSVTPLCRSEIPPVLLGFPWPALRGPLRNHFWKKRRPQPYWGGENSGNALEASNTLNYRVWGIREKGVLAKGVSAGCKNHLLKTPFSWFLIQKSPEQLVSTKDTKDKESEFSSPGGSEFLGSWDENSNCNKNTEIPHLGSLPSAGLFSLFWVKLLGDVSLHLPVGKKFLRFCLVWHA